MSWIMNKICQDNQKQITRLSKRVVELEAEVERLQAEIRTLRNAGVNLQEENDQLRKCCTQRGARMQIMKEWMENFEAGSLWTGSVWDALCEIRDSDVWFDADGVPK